MLLDNRMLDLVKICRAIEVTFERRRMSMPTAVPVGLSNAFALDALKQTQWNAFLKKNHLEALSLADVADALRGKFKVIGVI